MPHAGARFSGLHRHGLRKTTTRDISKVEADDPISATLILKRTQTLGNRVDPELSGTSARSFFNCVSAITASLRYLVRIFGRLVVRLAKQYDLVSIEVPLYTNSSADYLAAPTIRGSRIVWTPSLTPVDSGCMSAGRSSTVS